MNKFLIIAVVLLLWAHILPQVGHWYESGQIAKEVGCERSFTFYLLELDTEWGVHCPQYESYQEMINAQKYE